MKTLNLVYFSLLTLTTLNLFAKTNSYFTMTGDRVMINLQSGYPLDPQGDDDGRRLFNSINNPPENSIMGKGKKILAGDALSIIVADRGAGKFNGTIMITKDSDTDINFINKTTHLHWTNERAATLFKQFEPNNDLESKHPFFEYNSTANKLKIHADESNFILEYSEDN